MNKENSVFVMHEIPIDLQEALAAIPLAKAAWEQITPLARNEWICWVSSAKKLQTRLSRIERACNDLVAGKRRPCCWPGCSHRS